MSFLILIKNKKGFTLIELIVSIAVISLLAGLSMPIYQSFQTVNEIDVLSRTATNYLNQAQLFSQIQKDSSSWGVSLADNHLVLFSKNNEDEIETRKSYLISPGINVSGLTEIVFDRISGLPNNYGLIEFTAGSHSKNIYINEKGFINN